MNTQTLVTPDGSILSQVRRGYQPTPVEQLRIYGRGPVKDGKTSFLASIDHCLIIDGEGKARHVKDHGEGTDYFSPQASGSETALKNMERMITWLVQTGKSGKSPYKMVGFDTASEIIEAILKPGLAVEMTELNGYKFKTGEDITDYMPSPKGSRGWGVLTNRFLRYLRELTLAGYGWCVIDHEKEDRQNIKQGSQYVEVIKMRPAIHRGLFDGISRAAEVLGVFGNEAYEIREEKPLLNPDGSPKVIAGKTIMQTTSRSEIRYYLEPTTKVADTDALVGSNLNLPPRIFLTLGNGWREFTDAYRASLTPQSPMENAA